MMKPGDTEFTRTPRSAHSQPSCKVKLRNAPLAAVYAMMLASFAPLPMIEQMLTMLPLWRSSMWRPTSRMYMKAPLRSTEIIQFQVAMSKFSGETPRMSPTPALLINESILPCSLMAVSTTRMTSASTETSPVTTVTFEPNLRHRSATTSSISVLRAVKTRSAPALANPSAKPSPKPYEAPVMRIVLPVN